MGECNDHLEKLHASETFKEWKKAHEDSYLSYALIIKGSSNWQYGYYDPQKDRITSFTVDDEIKVDPDQEVFKESGTVKELDFDAIKLTLAQADAIGMERASEQDNGTILKKICIVQHVAPLGTVWNLTYVLSTLKTYNVKINAHTGDVLEEKMTSLAQFAKKDDGSTLQSQSKVFPSK